jgi:RNA polymerase-binding transcription factor DksA
MDKETIEELKSKLIKEKEEIEKSLEGIAKKDPYAPGGWRASVPDFDGGSMEEESDEVENYQNLLSQEASLESRLKEIKEALEKIKTGKYGICEKCKKEIEVERLQTYPAAKTCLKCK